MVEFDLEMEESDDMGDELEETATSDEIVEWSWVSIVSRDKSGVEEEYDEVDEELFNEEWLNCGDG